MPVFSALEREDMLGKITLLYPSQSNLEASADRPNAFTLPSLVLDGLFLSERPPRAPKKLAPLSTGPYSAVTSNGGLISPQSPARTVGRPIDTTVVTHFVRLPCYPYDIDAMISLPQPLHKRVSSFSPSHYRLDLILCSENPPPCNEHYLMTCSKGVRERSFSTFQIAHVLTSHRQAGICKYSHDYVLTPEQLVSLANNAKKAPCNWLKNGLFCRCVFESWN